jgi:hypothetical protein
VGGLERIERAAVGAGRWLGEPIERAGNRLSGRAGASLSALLFLISMSLRALLAILAGTVVGILRMLGGLVRMDGVLARRGFRDLATGWAGGVTAVLGSLLGFLQTLLFLQPLDRPLDSREREVLRRVYGDAVALDNVRIVAGKAGLFSVTPRPFTLGNRLLMQAVDTVSEVDVLVHECGHIWQHQHLGPRYIADALWAQWSYQWRGGNAYDWRQESRAKACWQDFNFEAQAEFLSAVFRGGRRAGLQGGGVFFDDPGAEDASFRLQSPDEDLTLLARATVEHVRRA